MSIDLTADEAAVLLDVLRQHLGNLKAEINRTETTGFREELKAREAIVAALIERIGALGSSAA